MFEHFQETRFRNCYLVTSYYMLMLWLWNFKTNKTNKLLSVNFWQQDFSITSDVLPTTSLTNHIFQKLLIDFKFTTRLQPPNLGPTWTRERNEALGSSFNLFQKWIKIWRAFAHKISDYHPIISTHLTLP